VRLPFVRRPLLLLLIAVPAAVAGASAALGQSDGTGGVEAGDNPCLSDLAPRLRCPDLEMKRPFGLRLERRGRRRLLRAGNSIDSVGRGPAELHGVRTSRRYMRARQRIYRVGRGRIGVSTGARLRFSYGHQRRYYWKFFHAARFELWRLNRRGRRSRLVRTGPKIAYCLRDLRRTHPVLRRSPRRRVYPACSTSRSRRRVTLGTSVGWSDIYPPGYVQQYINVTGLRGCFAYVHIADPRNGIFESDEDNNEAQVIVRLPFRPGRQRCRGRSTGEVNREHGPY
jgi:hypothetical protein